MNRISTGRQPLPLMVVASILSLSLVVNLPGLAVTPMLAQLKVIFPDSTQFEEQLLSLIPNLVIVPFLIISGRLSATRHKIGVVVAALLLFTASSVAYFFIQSMCGLIIVSVFLGAGAGLLIPFSTGLLSDAFSGQALTQQMGLQSGISNLTLVVATFVVGLLASGDWHLPFAVYLVALVPLAMAPLLKRIPKNELYTTPDNSGRGDTVAARVSPLRYGKTWEVIAVYFAITYLTMIVTLYCPYIIEKHDWSDTLSGTVSSVYFLFVFIPGFILPWILRRMRGVSMIVASAMIFAGLGGIALLPVRWMLIAGAGLCGLGYGIFQPFLYDKATKILPPGNDSTRTLAMVLVANYLAIVLTPGIVDGCRMLLNGGGGTFAFGLNAVLSGVLVAVSVIWRHKYALCVDSSYY